MSTARRFEPDDEISVADDPLTRRRLDGLITSNPT